MESESISVAANRVVLFDNHFNPTILTQALYRSYRYGQTKPVFAYRFMTEGSVEEKIYSRSVNKTGVSLRVIDNKTIARNFTERELQDLEETDTWVQCDRYVCCGKGRILQIPGRGLTFRSATGAKSGECFLQISTRNIFRKSGTVK